MRAIYRIARLELSNLFYSPIAWLILILFVFMTAMNFTDVLWAYARSQEFRGGGLSDLSRALLFDGNDTSSGTSVKMFLSNS